MVGGVQGDPDGSLLGTDAAHPGRFGDGRAHCLRCADARLGQAGPSRSVPRFGAGARRGGEEAARPSAATHRRPLAAQARLGTGPQGRSTRSRSTTPIGHDDDPGHGSGRRRPGPRDRASPCSRPSVTAWTGGAGVVTPTISGRRPNGGSTPWVRSAGGGWTLPTVPLQGASGLTCPWSWTSRRSRGGRSGEVSSPTSVPFIPRSRGDGRATPPSVGSSLAAARSRWTLAVARRSSRRPCVEPSSCGIGTVASPVAIVLHLGVTPTTSCTGLMADLPQRGICYSSAGAIIEWSTSPKGSASTSLGTGRCSLGQTDR
jgi:hypothetical protein